MLGLNGIFSILVLWAYFLMVKSNFDVVGKLETQAMTFILGDGFMVWKSGRKLRSYNGILKNPVPQRGQKCKDMALEKTLFPREFPVGSKNYLQHSYFVLGLVPSQISNYQKYFFRSEAGDPYNVEHNRDFLYFSILSITLDD
jgi:hypothetical protein